jgi:hypothetical protein
MVPTDVAERALSVIVVIVDEIRQEAEALFDLAARLEDEAARLRCPDTRGESA